MNNNDNHNDIPRLEAEEKIKIDIDFENLNIKKRKPFRFLIFLLLILLALIGAFIYIKMQNEHSDFDDVAEPSVDADLNENSVWHGAFESESIFNDCKEAAVSIIAEGKICSGFVYSSDGWIATVEGVVNENVKGRIEVVLFDGSRFFVESFRENRESGVILMKINADGLKAVRWSEKNEIFAGEELFTFCSIEMASEGASLFSGKVAHLQRNIELYSADGAARKVKLFQIGILLTEEGVGAPLFNKSGEIVGIACASGAYNERYMVDYAFAFDCVSDVLGNMRNGKRTEIEELIDVVYE